MTPGGRAASVPAVPSGHLQTTGSPRVAVLVGWRGGNRPRERAWAFVRKSWSALGWPIVEGDRPGPFNRSAARNDAAAKAGDWDVAVVIDADTLVRDPSPSLEAVRVAGETGRIVQPHTRYNGLGSRGTELVLAGSSAGWRLIYKTVDGSPLGVIVIPRVAWDTLGGFDERFEGWGGEDVAFGWAALTLTGITRLPGEIWHLWHPIDPTKRKYLAAKGGPLMARYRAARGDAPAMRALLDER